MNEEQPIQLGFDFRTVRNTAIDFGQPSSAQRAACTALNRERASGILAAAQTTSSGEPVSADVWNATFASESVGRDVPLISLSRMGITLDADGILGSVELRQLKSGAEAFPFADDVDQVVYKLFNLRKTGAVGALGKKVVLQQQEDERFEIVLSDATLTDTVEKLITLNDAGAHPTEIVGLSDDGNFLIAKQPLARPYVDFMKDRKVATEAILAVVPSFTRLNREIGVFWLRGKTWIICDLHNGNIMRDRENRPTIIDALLGSLPNQWFERLIWAREANEDSRALRLGEPRPDRKVFGDDVRDDEL